MDLLRRSHRLTRLVLVWFMLALGAAMASPLVKPDGLQWVCSGTVVKLVVGDGDAEGDRSAASGLDCPLCSSPTALPPSDPRTLPDDSGAQTTAQPPAARLGPNGTAPPPARGPPAIS